MFSFLVISLTALIQQKLAEKLNVYVITGTESGLRMVLCIVWDYILSFGKLEVY